MIVAGVKMPYIGRGSFDFRELGFCGPCRPYQKNKYKDDDIPK